MLSLVRTLILNDLFEPIFDTWQQPLCGSLECARAKPFFLSLCPLFESVDPIAAKGIDNIIPQDILSNAKGLAIFTVVKAGFLFSGRAGAGIVVARLEDGSWSAPSAIGTGGMGFGGQIGAEITDFVIVLNTQAAVKSFCKGGNVTLGGSLSGNKTMFTKLRNQERERRCLLGQF